MKNIRKIYMFLYVENTFTYDILISTECGYTRTRFWPKWLFSLCLL